MDERYQVTSFYGFFPIETASLDSVGRALEKAAEEMNIIGLVILAPEGINATVAGSPEALNQFKEWLCRQFPRLSDNFKDSRCTLKPFRRFSVKLRQEIVSSGDPQLIVAEASTKYLTPEQWHAELEASQEPANQSELTVLDVRNFYETKLGVFRGAVDPGIKNFQEFRRYVQESGIPKDQKVLMYCTGGIRCEKAAIEMQRQGYQNVFQLQGGILEYLAKYPHGHFAGECFVFDHRVALDSDLQPSKTYRLCPHCGDPGSIEIECVQCNNLCVLCSDCSGFSSGQAGMVGRKQTCSKNCQYHWELYLKRERASGHMSNENPSQ